MPANVFSLLWYFCIWEVFIFQNKICECSGGRGKDSNLILCNTMACLVQQLGTQMQYYLGKLWRRKMRIGWVWMENHKMGLWVTVITYTNWMNSIVGHHPLYLSLFFLNDLSFNQPLGKCVLFVWYILNVEWFPRAVGTHKPRAAEAFKHFISKFRQIWCSCFGKWSQSQERNGFTISATRHGISPYQLCHWHACCKFMLLGLG